MRCRILRTENLKAIVCGSAKLRPSCHKCFKGSQYQCDFPISKTKKGKVKTCDLHLCEDHARHGISAGVDFCDGHYPMAKAAYDRRMAAEAAKKPDTL